MAERSGMYDGVAGDRILDTALWQRINETLASEGVVAGAGFGDDLEVRQTSPVTGDVRVMTGRAWVQGRPFEVFSSPELVDVADADGSLGRIDRVVVRRDLAARETVLEYLAGTPAASPGQPALTQNPTGIWQAPLAQIVVPANATQIYTLQADAPSGQGWIVDERVHARTVLLPRAGGGWEHVDTGTHVGGDFTIDTTKGGIYPAGTFSRMRLEGRGHMDAAGSVFLRVNNDLTAAMHRRNSLTRRASDGTVVTADHADGTSWRVASWATAGGCLFVAELAPTDVPGQVGFRATSEQNGTGAANNITGDHWGRLNADRLVSSLRVAPSGGLLSSLRWWLEGYRE